MSRARKLTTMAVVLGAAAIVFLLMRGPVLLNLSDAGELRPAITILNPLRDRAPEVAAEELLLQLRHGQVAAVLRNVHGSAWSDQNEITDNEKRYPLKSWKLMLRQDTHGETVLTYRTLRLRNAQESTAVLAVRQTNGRWKVEGYAPVY
jgi:hypothetical protein